VAVGDVSPALMMNGEGVPPKLAARPRIGLNFTVSLRQSVSVQGLAAAKMAHI
jgi:hypothetical protein